MLLEQYTEAQAALLEGLALDPGHKGMHASMIAVDAALGPEPSSPTSPAAVPPKRCTPLVKWKSMCAIARIAPALILWL